MKYFSRSTFFLVIVALLSFTVRLYKITNPVLDWHAFRQADTASVTREYVKNGIDLLHPKYQDISNIASKLDNPAGYRMVEFPIINAAIATIIRFLPGLDVVMTSRLMAILASMVTLGGLYFLSFKYSGRQAAMWTAIWFGLLPFAVYYSRTVLPEPFLVGALTASLAFFYAFGQQKKWLYLLLSLLTLTLALLLKPFVLFFLPVYLAIYLTQSGYKSKTLTIGLLSLGLALIPLFLWRQWIMQFPSGIPSSDWLFNGNGIRLRPAWWRWLGYERMFKIILGGLGVIPILTAGYKLKKTELIFYGSWVLGFVAYLVIIATGNVQHDYYQYLGVPIICLLLGRGSSVLLRWTKQKFKSSRLAYGLLGLIVIGTVFLSGQKVKGYFLINHWEYQKAGRAVDALLPPDALVIAPAMGDTQFLYQTNRKGWPVGFEIESKINLGATHYVTTTMDDEARRLEASFFTVQKTPDYLILDLTRPNPDERTR